MALLFSCLDFLLDYKGQKLNINHFKLVVEQKLSTHQLVSKWLK